VKSGVSPLVDTATRMVPACAVVTTMVEVYPASVNVRTFILAVGRPGRASLLLAPWSMRWAMMRAAVASSSVSY